MTQPRGIRNHNPGNIELGTDWDGLSEVQTDGRFCQFDDPVYGIRAMARILKTYSNRYGINTIYNAIARWAPPFENDTKSYAAFVASYVNVDMDDVIDIGSDEVLCSMLPAMIKMENGVMPYDYSQIKKGVSLA